MRTFRPTALLVTLMVTCIALGATAMPATAADPQISGGGSTWSANAIDQWRADVARFGMKVNYQSVGSSAGRQFFIINQVDFAVSEIPFQPDELPRVDLSKLVYLPIVAGGTSLMYNLRDAAGRPVTNLRLSARTAAKIFTGQITNWAHPEITAENGGRVLPDRVIVPVVRSDGSGTSAQFSAYLAKMAPDVWQAFAAEQRIAPTFTSNWPIFNGATGQNGSDGVANYVNNEATGVGAITYVETSYAIERRRPVAAMKNQSGNYSLPTSRNVSIALQKARLNPDRTQVLDDVYVHPDPNAYPISSYSYMIARTKGFDPAKGSVVARFIYYFVCAGQAKAEPLGYSPLPPNLVQTAFDAAKQIPGAPNPPAFSECANPTIGGKDNSAAIAAGTNAGAKSNKSGQTSSAAGATGDAALAGSDASLSAEELAAEELADARTQRPAANVRITGDPGTTLPLVLAGVGLLLLVLVPPLLAGGLTRRTKPPS